MKEMYETDIYEQQNPTWHEGDSPWKAAQIEKLIRKNKLKFTSVCEIGCGTGEILLNLERAFPEAELSGYEIAPTAYQRAAPKESDKTKFFLEDLLAQDEKHFDLMLAIDVMEHVEDYISFAKKLKPMAEYKIFHIPLDLSAQSVIRARPIMGLRRDVGHLHYFFKQTALATLEDCGYTIIDHAYTASRLELPNQALSSRVMRLPRRAMYAINPDLAVRLMGGYSLLVLAQ